MKLKVLLQSGGVVAALLGTSPVRAPAQSDSATGHPPRALMDAGEHGEDLYDAAVAGDWTTACRQLKALKASVATLAPTVRSDAEKGERLEQEIAALDSSVAHRERRATMVVANQVTLTVADLTARFAPRIPVAITRLDYYGRELAIGAAAGDDARLKAAVRGARHEWDSVRAAVAARAPGVARKFEDLVSWVEHVPTHGEYRRLAAQLLDEVDELERVMGSPPPRGRQ